MATVHFGNAFDRWHALLDKERARLAEETARGRVTLSWEAVDHLCGLAVESAMKALLLNQKLVTPDASGDYPADAIGRRPHVNELWDTFLTKANNRKTSHWIATLGGGRATPANVFAGWRSEHRYAPDGTVPESAVRARLEMEKRLKRITQEEGL